VVEQYGFIKDEWGKPDYPVWERRREARRLCPSGTVVEAVVERDVNTARSDRLTLTIGGLPRVLDAGDGVTLRDLVDDVVSRPDPYICGVNVPRLLRQFQAELRSRVVYHNLLRGRALDPRVDAGMQSALQRVTEGGDVSYQVREDLVAALAEACQAKDARGDMAFDQWAAESALNALDDADFDVDTEDRRGRAAYGAVFNAARELALAAGDAAREDRDAELASEELRPMSPEDYRGYRSHVLRLAARRAEDRVYRIVGEALERLWLEPFRAYLEDRMPSDFVDELRNKK